VILKIGGLLGFLKLFTVFLCFLHRKYFEKDLLQIVKHESKPFNNESVGGGNINHSQILKTVELDASFIDQTGAAAVVQEKKIGELCSFERLIAMQMEWEERWRESQSEIRNLKIGI